MTHAERVAAALAVLSSGMRPEFAATLKALNDAEQAKAGAEPVTAFRAALTAFLKTHERTGNTWGKRASEATTAPALPGIQLWNYNTICGDALGAGNFACKNCLRIQGVCLCQACGNAGPGNCCWSCGRELAYSCPKCAAPWQPLQLEDVAGGGRMSGLVTETRMSEDKKFGHVRAILTGNVEDDYGTTISPLAISKLIQPGLCLIDIDHQVCKHGRTSRQGCPEHDGPIFGADCEGVTYAKVPYEGKNVDAAIVDSKFDLSQPRSKMLYDRILDGTYPEVSVLFEYPKAVAEAVAAGRQKTLDETNLISAPAYTFTRKGHASNPMAKVTEIRTSRVLAARTMKPITDAPVINGGQVVDQAASDKLNGAPAPTTEAKPATPSDAPATPPADETAIPEADAILAGLAQAVDSIGEGTAVPPATESVESPAPATPPEAPAGGAPEPSLEALSQQVNALSTVVEGLRTAAPSQEWKPGHEALTSKLNDLAIKLEGQRKLIAECAVLQQKGYRNIKAEIARITTIPNRVSHSGADNSELSEAMRTVLEPDPETKRQRAKDAHEETMNEFLGRVSVSPL